MTAVILANIAELLAGTAVTVLAIGLIIIVMSPFFTMQRPNGAGR